MKSRAFRSLARRCGGWGTSEYVLLTFWAFYGFWRAAQYALTMIREHHQEFSWALILPF